MEVILLKQSKLGKIGDIVSVKDGFARNYLMPTGMAQRATEANKKDFALKREELERIEQEAVKYAEDIKMRLGQVSITLVREASRDMKLYGAISASDIAGEIHAKYGIEIDPSVIIIQKRIKEVGISDAVHLKLHHNVTVPVELNVLAREGSQK